MKRLPALMLSVFLLTLLSLPSKAATSTGKGPSNGVKELPVYLAVNAVDIVDVTISWSPLSYTYCSSGFVPEDGTTPMITVINNNPQNNIVFTPEFVPDSIESKYFELYFYQSKDEKPGEGTDVKKQVINGKDSFSFYAIPSGDPLDWSEASKNATRIGNVKITISLDATDP